MFEDGIYLLIILKYFSHNPTALWIFTFSILVNLRKYVVVSLVLIPVRYIVAKKKPYEYILIRLIFIC